MPKDLHENICKEHIFSGIYNKYLKDLSSFLYYKYGERLNPNDKAQEAFIKLWEHCKKVTLQTAKAFLFKTANNMMLNEVKHQKVVLKYEKEGAKSYTNESPEFILLQEEFLKQYQQALANLTEEQRVAFMLNKAEGKKHSEIAEMLGVTQKVVEYRIYSAFKQLKEQLGDFKLK
ncbi:RNA polymerase sigma factor [Ascidiimonas sp. W6]|uniref:RNA polymerase sigma factor n=1 Tax=Ascidiimonas meishanensis TaxID=3128903 RepID=UPI0030EF18AC